MKKSNFFKKSNTIFATTVIIIVVCTLAGCQTDDPNDTIIDPYTDAGVTINGVRWATRNVDAPGTFAATPTDTGMFYQWNRRVGWFFMTTNAGSFLTNSDNGRTWNRTTPTGTTWERANDPCPPGWRVPTHAEFESLVEAGSEWITIHGVDGRLFGTVPNQIFLPIVGHLNNTLNGALINTHIGFYWSSTNWDYYLEGFVAVYVLALFSYQYGVSHIERDNGKNVRCVAR
jgi:uncharacterized protein (TIGR02145 family)